MSILTILIGVDSNGFKAVFIGEKGVFAGDLASGVRVSCLGRSAMSESSSSLALSN